MEFSLNHMLPGQKGFVIGIVDCGDVSCRLQRFGISNGVKISCIRKNKNGQMMVLQVDESSVRLPTRDLEKVRVRV